MFLFFDTETTGLPRNYKAPITDTDNWPRLVQLAWLLMDKDGKELKSENVIIKPEGFIIPEASSVVHGITTEQAIKEGIALTGALKDFSQMIETAKLVVGHNISFDEKIIGAEFLRKKIESELFDRVRFCTMHSSTDFCQIPGKYGYKWPKLMELHHCLFDEGFDGAHDALADVRATARCFFEMLERKII
ncbi:MAG: 3'-5' exonuclease [Patescibacteria group bacterium]|nr:3'-5' exonuclease [Patescibacteria group bacterium]